MFTGLSGAGKSTIAGRLVELLQEAGRTVTLLDGDEVRTHLSAELGFSKAGRDANVRRIGWVAAQIAKHGGLAVCAPIAPYAATRADARRLVEEQAGPGSFVLVHVATSLADCEARDRKGLYARARRGEIAEFTGISDPYEEPTDAELTIDTRSTSAEESARRVLAHLLGDR
ncbi:adenylyl-sulfate kinase [Modestobacter muralis]|uniref:Adenylyl-sulfate kinase n=2 Tax=Modestobacter muralis TaxID=1608614 RepID=A0A6P0EUB3_9ACTN|nr:adenylyl-sulfate kinase [Modestobacter muralis]NEN51388.1 adenylyl-sulfate kinase [Modestobacter muralis]